MRIGIQCTAFDFRGIQQCEAGINSQVLDVTASDTQQMPEWCWAACISGVFAYYGHFVPQQRVVQETWGAVVNMPAQPEQILQALNRPWTDNNGHNFTSSGAMVLPPFAAQDLAADHPLIIGTLGHAMLLTSLIYFRDVNSQGVVSAAKVRDPWPLNPRRRVLSTAEWMNTVFIAHVSVINA
jgi:hypothetical protein